MPYESIYYTHAEWRVKPGCEVEFITAWRALGATFAALEQPPEWGTLLRSESEPGLFYSFGPWPDAEAIAAMRANSEAQVALQRVRDLCEKASPGMYRQVAHVSVRDQGT